MKLKQLLIFFSLFLAILFQSQGQASTEDHSTGTESQAHPSKGHDPEHLAQEMSALFPQPKPDLGQQERPSKPDLASPSFYENMPAGNVTLTWKPSNGADCYHVQVATDANFKWLVSESFDVKGTSYDVNVEGGKNYYWRVLGAKMSNVSQFTKSNFSSSMFRVK